MDRDRVWRGFGCDYVCGSGFGGTHWGKGALGDIDRTDCSSRGGRWHTPRGRSHDVAVIETGAAGTKGEDSWTKEGLKGPTLSAAIVMSIKTKGGRAMDGQRERIVLVIFK